MEEDGLSPKATISRRDIEDAEVLTKSAEIDISEAEKTGADLSEAKQFLEEAKGYLENRDIMQVRISVKKAKTAAADAKRYHRSDLLIQHAVPVVEDAKRNNLEGKSCYNEIIITDAYRWETYKGSKQAAKYYRDEYVDYKRAVQVESNKCSDVCTHTIKSCVSDGKQTSVASYKVERYG